ncbi:mo25 protein [Malassezia pachydermatis]|uniref:Mo25 protein n=1 Tax=Malassezia pachydermatis TaxID=77020 RepID=A0A0M8MP55_9BASI|nr:mo25 protein [Malassezia pachydermatis]KOS16426.1 mo25 protein [Malassezia pachydermatis]
MNFLFKHKPRTPTDIARILKELCVRLGASESPDRTWTLVEPALSMDQKRKILDEFWSALQQAKIVLYGEEDHDPVPEHVAQFAQEVYQLQLMMCLLVVLPRLEFETRKDIVQVFIALLQRTIGARRPTVEYIRSNPIIVHMAFHGYDSQDVALNTGMILHEMVQHETLAKILLYSDDLSLFPIYIETTPFSVSCDAFKNLRDALILHRTMAAEFLQHNYDRFFTMYTQLLRSENYVTRRQSLKLLSDILVDRVHYATMIRYVSDEENLKSTMNALRDRSKNIQLEAFHVFKVFVANPKKTPAVEAILRRNRDRLLSFLQGFLQDRTDESFIDELPG